MLTNSVSILSCNFICSLAKASSWLTSPSSLLTSENLLLVSANCLLVVASSLFTKASSWFDSNKALCDLFNSSAFNLSASFAAERESRLF